MKTLTRFGLALSVLALTATASAAAPVRLHPRSFDYYDANGVEITGIDLNLGGFSHDRSSLRHYMDDAVVMHPRSFQYVDENGVVTTGIDLNLGEFCATTSGGIISRVEAHAKVECFETPPYRFLVALLRQ